MKNSGNSKNFQLLKNDYNDFKNYCFFEFKDEKIIIKKFKNKNISYAILRYFNVVDASPSNKFDPISAFQKPECCME